MRSKCDRSTQKNEKTKSNESQSWNNHNKLLFTDSHSWKDKNVVQDTQRNIKKKKFKRISGVKQEMKCDALNAFM